MPQRFRQPEAARLRPAKKSKLARDAAHGQDIGITARGSACRRRQSNSTARLRPVQDAEITVRSAISAPPPFRKLHCSGQRQPNSLMVAPPQGGWSDTTAAGCGQVCQARPCHHRVAAHALRSAVVESENWLSRWRDDAGKRDPARMLLALRRRWHEGTADTTLLTSLRGWVSALLSRQPHKRCYL